MSPAPAERQQRIKKLQRLRELGQDPFAHVKYDRTHHCAQVRGNFAELQGQKVRVAGRIMAIRRHGKVTFADLHDYSGRLQIQARFDLLGPDRYEQFTELVDLGDILGVHGEVFKTRTGEVTVAVEDYTILAKALRPLPEKYHGLRDVELRSRRRYLDLIMNPEVRERFVARARMVDALREQLRSEGFIEVETPMMQPIYGGAAARPFITHHNALDMDLYLRIAPELYLKRLIVGGYEKVFEIGRVFRNEGVDARHNPEFTILEAYQAYADYRDMMRLVERLICAMAQAGPGSLKIPWRDGEIDLTPPWREVSYYDALREASGIDWEEIKSDGEAVKAAHSRGLDLGEPPPETRLQVMDRIFERLVQPELIQPTFVVDFPVEISPLAKRHPDKPHLTQRFEPVIAGMEVGNAFSELNDPLDQRERFEQQARLRARGEEAHPIDEDFLLALEHAMPPTGGIGLGIDRLAMILLGVNNIREVILFPLLRPED